MWHLPGGKQFFVLLNAIWRVVRSCLVPRRRRWRVPGPNNKLGSAVSQWVRRKRSAQRSTSNHPESLELNFCRFSFTRTPITPSASAIVCRAKLTPKKSRFLGLFLLFPRSVTVAAQRIESIVRMHTGGLNASKNKRQLMFFRCLYLCVKFTWNLEMGERRKWKFLFSRH